jgi:hypothetical protein
MWIMFKKNKTKNIYCTAQIKSDYTVRKFLHKVCIVKHAVGMQYVDIKGAVSRDF